MPIRINLLAEAQAAEEERRKDPVKRAIWGAAGAVVLVVAGIGYLQLEAMTRSSRLLLLDGDWTRTKPRYDQVLQNKKKIDDANSKMAALQNYAAERFVWGSVLNAFSQAMTNVSNVQVTRLQTEQLFAAVPAAKPGTPAAPAAASTARPGSVTERIKITLTAKDFGKENDENYNKMREAIADFPYFKERLDKARGIRLENLSPRSVDPLDPAKSFVQFVLECQFSDRNY